MKREKVKTGMRFSASKMFFNVTLALALVGGALGSGCGNATSTIDPFQLMTDSSIPSLDTIIPQTSVYTTLVAGGGFSSSNPYWVFSTGAFYGTNALSPADGYITEVGTSTVNGFSVNYVTILHSGRFSTRIFGVTLTTVRPGDAVVRGQVIGTFISIGSGFVGFQVLLDGTPVCPLSFMSSSFRTLLQTTVFTQTAGTVCAP